MEESCSSTCQEKDFSARIGPDFMAPRLYQRWLICTVKELFIAI